MASFKRVTRLHQVSFLPIGVFSFLQGTPPCENRGFAFGSLLKPRKGMHHQTRTDPNRRQLGPKPVPFLGRPNLCRESESELCATSGNQTQQVGAGCLFSGYSSFRGFKGKTQGKPTIVGSPLNKETHPSDSLHVQPIEQFHRVGCECAWAKDQ